jgi:transposase
MPLYPARALERAMKIREVITRAISGKINWIQAAEILGMSDRQLRRWRKRWDKCGYDGLFDHRTRQPSPKRVAMAEVEAVLKLYREKYFDLNVKHFVEKLRAEEQIWLSYTWVKTALQHAGLVRRYAKRGPHRKKRPRRPLTGMMLHVDGSRHQWIPGLDEYQDLIVIFDDATSEVYDVQLVQEESTVTVMACLKRVVESRGLFCSLYSDRGSHMAWTPKAGGLVDREHPTQIARALKELGIDLILAYSPQARGRCERIFGTWQGRLPQELRLHGITASPKSHRVINLLILPSDGRTVIAAC